MKKNMAFILFAALATGTAFADQPVSELDKLRDDVNFLLIEKNINDIYKIQTDIAKNKESIDELLKEAVNGDYVKREIRVAIENKADKEAVEQNTSDIATNKTDIAT
ncbi:hypothetical protein ACE4RU_04315, partial [Actinobacillus seminis]